jgi:hypothetical protein
LLIPDLLLNNVPYIGRLKHTLVGTQNSGLLLAQLKTKTHKRELYRVMVYIAKNRRQAERK